MPPKTKKGPFDDLNPEFKETVDSLTSEAQLRDRIAKVAIDNAALKDAEEEDQDLDNLKEQVKIAREPYALGYKQHKLMIKYLRQRLSDLGKPNGDSGLEDLAEQVDDAKDF